MYSRMFVQRHAPRCEAGNGEQKIGCQRRVGRSGYRLGLTLGCDEAGVTAFPSLELLIKKGPARCVVRQRGQVTVHVR